VVGPASSSPLLQKSSSLFRPAPNYVPRTQTAWPQNSKADGVGARTAEVVVAADDDCSLTTSGSIALSEDTTEHEATTTARPARTRERRFMSDTVPQVLVNRTIS
jgi:hypothetical protein